MVRDMSGEATGRVTATIQGIKDDPSTERSTCPPEVGGRRLNKNNILGSSSYNLLLIFHLSPMVSFWEIQVQPLLHYSSILCILGMQSHGQLIGLCQLSAAPLISSFWFPWSQICCFAPAQQMEVALQFHFSVLHCLFSVVMKTI